MQSRKKGFTNVVKEAVLVIIILMIQDERTSTNHCNRHGGQIGKEKANTQRGVFRR